MQLRIVRRFAVLVALPCALLVPLAFVKWRADHPPLSKTDRLVRTSIGRALEVRFTGMGQKWNDLSGLDGVHSFVVKDKALLREVSATLRCTDQEVTLNPAKTFDMNINLGIPMITTSPSRFEWRHLFYLQDSTGTYLWPRDERGVWKQAVVVQPRFVPQFEALIARMARQSQSDVMPESR